MAYCSEQIALFQNIKELQSDLSQLIERVSDSQKVALAEKNEILLKIYSIRKQAIELIEECHLSHYFDLTPGDLDDLDFDLVNDYLIRKTKKKHVLTKRELIFVYELHKIDPTRENGDYFYEKKFEELKSLRNIKNDLSQATGYLPEEISLDKSELKFGITKFHYGDIDLKTVNFDGVDESDGTKFPEIVFGNLQLENAVRLTGVTLPRIVGGFLNLNKIKSLAGVIVIPEVVRSGIHLDGIKSVKDVWIPDGFKGNLSLSGLTSAQGLNLPREVKSLYLDGLESTEGLVLPDIINDKLCLKRIKSAEGLRFPVIVGGKLDLRSLITAKGLELPESVGYDLNLQSLKSIKDLRLPRDIGGSIDLRSIVSADGLVFPKTIHGFLFLTAVESTRGLVLPEVVDGTLDLRSITSPNGLVLPKESHGSFFLDGLKSAKGVIFPRGVDFISLNDLETIDGLEFPEEIHSGVSVESLSTELKKELHNKYPKLKIR